MAHDVFITYSSRDKPIADAACAMLEGRRIRCWIAPRDVAPGREYTSEILRAIETAKVLVVLVSNGANQSPHVVRELERAVSKGLSVLPFRVEEVTLSPSLEYLISTQHWIDALNPPLEAHLNQLADAVAALLSISARPAGSPAPLEPPARNLNAGLSAVFRVRVISGPDTGATKPIGQTRLTFGRGRDCDVVLKDGGLSRSHFAINWDASRRGFTLVDFGATNPVLVNGVAVSGSSRIAIGDVIRCGSTEIVLEAGD